MVFTGEGKLDSQSLRGKVVMGIARRTKRQDVHIPFTKRCHVSRAEVTKHLPFRKKYEPWLELNGKAK
jgi:glycerate kinase